MAVDYPDWTARRVSNAVNRVDAFVPVGESPTTGYLLIPAESRPYVLAQLGLTQHDERDYELRGPVAGVIGYGEPDNYTQLQHVAIAPEQGSSTYDVPGGSNQVPAGVGIVYELKNAPGCGTSLVYLWATYYWTTEL